MDEQPNLHRFTLRFGSAEMEEAYLQDYFHRSIPFVRFALVLGFSLYALFGFLDQWMAPDVESQILIIRTVVCILLAAVFCLTYSKSFLRCNQLILTFTGISTGVGIVAMVFIMSEEASHHYYAGLLLVFFFAHVLLRLRFVYASTATMIILLLYETVAIFFKETPATIVVNNSFFLASSNIMVMVASYELEFYLRKVFWQNTLLEERRRQLDAEHERKTRELQAFRRIQLAMLPKELPNHPSVTIAAHMKTASEVGGDYYDFYQAEDGSLTVAIGDATGHGAQAGSMVTATKLLFSDLAHQELIQILEKSSSALSIVGSSMVFMAFGLARLSGNVLELAGSGMPAAVIYRASEKRVEQFELNGIPLGSPLHIAYTNTSTLLNPGDTVLLMSDGLPELFDERQEMFGYDNAAQLLAEVGHKTPQEVIDFYLEAATKWSNHPFKQDDMTFVVMKMNQAPDVQISAQ